MRDLGVTLDTNFTSSLHCREDPTHPKVAFIPPYCAMLRPHLKFAMEAKFSTLRVDIDQPERVNGLQHGRLCQRNLFSPERRRLRVDLNLALKGEVDLARQIFLPPTQSRAQRTHLHITTRTKSYSTKEQCIFCACRQMLGQISYASSFKQTS